MVLFGCGTYAHVLAAYQGEHAETGNSIYRRHCVAGAQNSIQTGNCIILPLPIVVEVLRYR
jgi:hypothetical protein